MAKIKQQPLGKEEYWANEYHCPYCEDIGMHQCAKYCCNCGKSFDNVEFVHNE